MFLKVFMNRQVTQFCFQNCDRNFEAGQEMEVTADTGHLVPLDVLDYLADRSLIKCSFKPI